LLILRRIVEKELRVGTNDDGNPVMADVTGIKLSTAGGKFFTLFVDAGFGGNWGAVATDNALQLDAVDAGTPVNLAVGSKTKNRVELRWSPVFGAIGYKVYRASTSAGPFALVNAAQNRGPSFVDSGRAASNSYYYKVSAVNPVGSESIASAPVMTTTAAVPSTCDPWHADNYSHTVAGRAFVYFDFTDTWGSGNYMGPWTIFDESQLSKVGSNYYVGTCS